MAASTNKRADRSLVLWIVGAVFVATVVFSIFGPKEADDDPRPTTYNAGTQGLKVAFLLTSQLGYGAERATGPETWLATVDASKTTAVFAEPVPPVKDLKRLQDAVAEFINRGGRVLATGSGGARLLPGGETAAPTHVYQGLCYSQPEGPGSLARVGTIATTMPVRWSALGPQFRVEQRCGVDGVVVALHHGEGEAVWWSSPQPMTNGAMMENSNLKLLLATLGPAAGRTIIFDEYLHEQHETIFDTVGGLPWRSLGWQLALIGLLLILSFSRRNGPLRASVTLPRTSPIEFAESMGRLYASAGATEAAVGAAERRLLTYLGDRCGVAPEVLRGPAQGIGEVLQSRTGEDWSDLISHLDHARNAEGQTMTAKSALSLIQALELDETKLREKFAMRRAQTLRRD